MNALEFSPLCPSWTNRIYFPWRQQPQSVVRDTLVSQSPSVRFGWYLFLLMVALLLSSLGFKTRVFVLPLTGYRIWWLRGSLNQWNRWNRWNRSEWRVHPQLCLKLQFLSLLVANSHPTMKSRGQIRVHGQTTTLFPGLHTLCSEKAWRKSQIDLITK